MTEPHLTVQDTAGKRKFSFAPDQLNWKRRYGVACACVLVAFLLRLTFFGSLDTRLPFGFFLIAVMVASWYGGLGPGLLASAIGLLLGGYFFMPPQTAPGATGEAVRTGITVYVINSTLISILMDNLHARIRKLQCGTGKSMQGPKAES